MADNTSEQSKINSETEASNNQKGLSKEAWTAISAISVALIGGIVTIVTILIPNTPVDRSTQSSTNSSPVTSSPVNSLVTADAIASKWMGKAKTLSGQSYTINLEILRSCKLDEECGTISVLEIPCYGEISLNALHNNDYEFDVSNFNDRSSTQCEPGAGEHFKLLPDGRLSYKADWGVQGILDKME